MAREPRHLVRLTLPELASAAAVIGAFAYQPGEIDRVSVVVVNSDRAVIDALFRKLQRALDRASRCEATRGITPPCVSTTTS